MRGHDGGRLRGELQRLAGEEAERLARLGDRRLGRFGAEGELLGADEGDVVEPMKPSRVRMCGSWPSSAAPGPSL